MKSQVTGAALQGIGRKAASDSNGINLFICGTPPFSKDYRKLTIQESLSNLLWRRCRSRIRIASQVARKRKGAPAKR
jgi:hypothetical protein